jgi:hypothetical protein
MPITGGCLCGAVRYEITGPLLDAGNCHCSMCRKGHGAAFATYANLNPAEFQWTRGEEFVSHYESSANATRIFCSVCGSTLGASTAGKIDSVTLGTVEGNPGIVPRSHIFVGSKAPWHDISDALPQFEGWPPGEAWA